MTEPRSRADPPLFPFVNSLAPTSDEFGSLVTMTQQVGQCRPGPDLCRLRCFQRQSLDSGAAQGLHQLQATSDGGRRRFLRLIQAALGAE